MSFVPPPGTTLVCALGAGSVFEVAVVRRDGREHICKRLRPRMLQELPARRALEREARLLERVRHPTLPELFESSADAWGPYLLESCLRGATLRELVEGWQERGAAMPVALVSHVVRAAFDALAQLHACADHDGPLELVHGDLGPDHVVLGEAGQIYFVDFGQARWRGMDRALCGADRGTLPFVAPELARGEVEPDQSSDVFALGATMAFAALGRPPCGADTPAALLVEVSEHGLDLAALASSERLDLAARAALGAALRFDRSARLLRAVDVRRLLSP
jgi:eukaryotic-like serine/threonine-protein kinase